MDDRLVLPLTLDEEATYPMPLIIISRPELKRRPDR